MLSVEYKEPRGQFGASLAHNLVKNLVKFGGSRYGLTPQKRRLFNRSWIPGRGQNGQRRLRNHFDEKSSYDARVKQADRYCHLAVGDYRIRTYDFYRVNQPI